MIRLFECKMDKDSVSVTRDWLIGEIAKIEIEKEQTKAWLPEELAPMVQSTVFLDNRFIHAASEAKDVI